LGSCWVFSMTTNHKVKVALFGTFRNYTAANPIELSLPDGANIADVKAALILALEISDNYAPIEALVQTSALADDYTILSRDFTLNGDVNLAILPPVSGG